MKRTLWNITFSSIITLVAYIALYAIWGAILSRLENLTLVDDGHIYVCDKVMFGPNVTVATANHPIDPELQGRGLQYNKDVYIGENTWIGACAVIVPRFI